MTKLRIAQDRFNEWREGDWFCQAYNSFMRLFSWIPVRTEPTEPTEIFVLAEQSVPTESLTV